MIEIFPALAAGPASAPAAPETQQVPQDPSALPEFSPSSGSKSSRRSAGAGEAENQLSLRT